MSIQITITDPTRDEALHMADYLFALAGYGKKDGIVSHERADTGAVSHRFETTPAQVDTQLKAHIESLAARTPVEDEAALVGTAADVPDETPSAPTELDSAGHAWDERIHASSRAVVSDGTWRLRRNLDPKVLEAVLAERVNAPVMKRVADVCAEFGTSPDMTVTGLVKMRDNLNEQYNPVFSDTPPPAPGAWPFPSDASIPPLPPAATVSVGVSPPPPAAPCTRTFAAFMQRVTAAIGAGTIAQTDVTAALAEYGVASIPLLASVHADKIDAVAARLGV